MSRESKDWSRKDKAQLAVDIAGILASIAVSVAILMVGQQYSDVSREAAENHDRSSQVTRKRVELWDKMAGDLNDIYCYFTFRGNWKELTERDVLARKRRLDALVYGYRPFFTESFFSAYQTLMNQAFAPFQAWPQDAALRTVPIRPLDKSVDPGRFTNVDNGGAVHDAYFELLNAAAVELDLKDFTIPPRPDPPTDRSSRPQIPGAGGGHSWGN